MSHAPHAPATAATGSAGTVGPAPVCIPRLQLSSWGAATEDEQKLYGAKPRLSSRQAIAAAKDEAAAHAAVAAAAANADRSAGGWSPRGHPTTQPPRSSTSPSSTRAPAHTVSQLHLSPGRRVSVSPSGRGPQQRSSVSPSGRTVSGPSSGYRAGSTVGLSPRGVPAGSSPRAHASSTAGYSPRSVAAASPRGAAAGSSPRGAPPGTQQRFYAHALRQTPMQPPQQQQQQHPYAQSPRSHPDSRSHMMAAAGPRGSSSASSSLSQSAAGDDLLRRLSELEVDLRARLHSLHVDFEDIKYERAAREALQDQLDNLEAALTSFPFHIQIRQTLLNIIRKTEPNSTAAAGKNESNVARSNLRQTEPLPDPSPKVIAARSAAADSASLVHTAPELGTNQQQHPNGASVPASALTGGASADSARRASGNQPQHHHRPPTAPVPVAMFALPSLPASAESTFAAAPVATTANLHPDEASQQMEAGPKVVRRSAGAKPAPGSQSPPSHQHQQQLVDRHPNLASSLTSSAAADQVPSSAGGAGSSSLTASLSASFPVEYAPLETRPTATAAATPGVADTADDPLDKLLVFPPPSSRR